MYDVYGRHLSPSIPELERDNEDILMIQYADNGRDGSGNNTGNANSVGVSVNVNVDVDNDQPSSSNSNVPSTSGISRVCLYSPSLFFSLYRNKILNILYFFERILELLSFSGEFPQHIRIKQYESSRRGCISEW